MMEDFRKFKIIAFQICYFLLILIRHDYYNRLFDCDFCFKKDVESILECLNELVFDVKGLTDILIDLNSILEWCITSSNFHYLLNFCLISTKGGEDDPLLSPLLYFWDIIYQQNNHHSQTEWKKRKAKKRKAKIRLSKSKRVSRNYQTSIDQLIPGEKTTLTFSKKKLSTDTYPSSVRNSKRRVTEDTQQQQQQHIKKGFDRMEEQYSLKECRQLTECMKSLLCLLRCLCSTTLPTILWVYLSRCVFCTYHNWDTPHVDDDISGLLKCVYKALRLVPDGFHCVQIPPINLEDLDVNSVTLSRQGTARRVLYQNGKVNDADKTSLGQDDNNNNDLNYDLIDEAMEDEVITSISKSKNPLMESAMSAFTFIGTVLETTSLKNNLKTEKSENQNKIIEFMTSKQKTFNLAFDSLKMTERLFPWLTLMSLKLIDYELCPLLQELNEFLEFDYRLKKEDDLITSQKTINQKKTNSGLFIPSAILHQFVHSVGSCTFHSIESVMIFPFNPPSAPDPQTQQAYRFVVDDDLMIIVGNLLHTLQSEFRDEPQKNKSDTNHDDTNNHNCWCLCSRCLRLSFYQCQLRCECEILPKAILSYITKTVLSTHSLK